MKSHFVAVLAFLVPLGGCARMLRAATDSPDPDAIEVAEAAAPSLGCVRTNVVAVEDKANGEQGFPWSATGCGATAACRNTDQFGWYCLRRPLSDAWTGGDEDVFALKAIERLALETGCAAPKIVLTGGIGPSLGFSESMKRRRAIDDLERVFRLRACGSVFVCSVAAGRTDCKGALEVAPADLRDDRPHIASEPRPVALPEPSDGGRVEGQRTPLRQQP